MILKRDTVLELHVFVDGWSSSLFFRFDLQPEVDLSSLAAPEVDAAGSPQAEPRGRVAPR